MVKFRDHVSRVGNFASDGTQGANFFYPSTVHQDPFGGRGTLLRTMTWPKVDLFWGGVGDSNVPPEFNVGKLRCTWIAWYSHDGSIPPWNLISPLNTNCVLRSGLTPMYWPSHRVDNGFHITFTSESRGIESKRMVKSKDPLIAASLITGFWVNDNGFNTAEYPDFSIHGSSTDYTIWEGDDGL
jgi:hypothetical protein